MPQDDRQNAPRVPVTPAGLLVARAGLGAAYLLMPALRSPGGPRPSPAVRVARVLGLRQLAQAALTSGDPGRPVLVLGAGTDALHAASMVALAACSARWRRQAGLDAVVAASLAAAGVAAARLACPRPPASGPLAAARDECAGRLARYLLPGPARAWALGPDAGLS